MQTKLQLQVSPQTALNQALLKEEVRLQLSVDENSSLHIKILRRSIDARGRAIKINLTVLAAVNESIADQALEIHYADVSASLKSCHIIGAGPAGLFAALRCLETGIKPIIIERGKDVKARRRDLAAINKDHLVKPGEQFIVSAKEAQVLTAMESCIRAPINAATSIRF